MKPTRWFLLFASLVALLPLWNGCASGLGRGSENTLYSYSDILEVRRSDAGKSIQMKLDQKLFINFVKDPENPGQWSLVDYNNRTLLMLNEHPTTAPGYWGVLLQARALGTSSIKLKFTPIEEAETPTPTVLEFDISIHR